MVNPMPSQRELMHKLFERAGSALVHLYSVPGGIIAGDNEVNLEWIPTEQIAGQQSRFTVSKAADEFPYVIPAAPRSRRLVAPWRGEQVWPWPGDLAQPEWKPTFRTEEIALTEQEVAGWRVLAGYGPKSRIWYVSQEEPKRTG